MRCIDELERTSIIKCSSQRSQVSRLNMQPWELTCFPNEIDVVSSDRRPWCMRWNNVRIMHAKYEALPVTTDWAYKQCLPNNRRHTHTHTHELERANFFRFASCPILFVFHILASLAFLPCLVRMQLAGLPQCGPCHLDLITANLNRSHFPLRIDHSGRVCSTAYYVYGWQHWALLHAKAHHARAFKQNPIYGLESNQIFSPQWNEQASLGRASVVFVWLRCFDVRTIGVCSSPNNGCFIN